MKEGKGGRNKGKKYEIKEGNFGRKEIIKKGKNKGKKGGRKEGRIKKNI